MRVKKEKKKRWRAKFQFCALFLFFAAINGFAQSRITEDDQKFMEDSVRIATPRAVRPQLRLDARTSSFERQKINIYGYDAGILIDNKLRLALGYYRINNDLPNDVDLRGVKSKLQLRINCGALNTEVIYYNARYLSLGFPLEFGFGNYKLKHTSSDDGRVLEEKSGFLGFTNFGLSATFKPIRWFGLKGILGYRKTIYPAERIFPFNGVFSSIGLNVDIQTIVRDVRMYCLLKKHKRNFSGLRTFTDIITE
jgi:hypothetical protein